MATKRELQKALVMKNLQLQSSGATNLKQYESAFQDTIEGMFPDKCWWEVTDCDIFGKLFETRDPDVVITDIIANLKPDALEENIQISSRFGRKLTEGKTYEYKGYTIDVFEDCWRVYNRNNGKQVGGDFATDKDAEEYIDSLTESLKESKSTDYRGYVIDYDFYGNGEYTVQYCGDDITFDNEQEAKAFIDNLYESFTGSGKPNIRESKVRTHKGNKRVNRHTSHKLTESVNRKHRNRTLREWVDVDDIEHPNDDMGGYTCYSYYGRNYTGLEDDFETYDYTDVELWVWNKLHQGNYCVVETPDGRLYFNPDKVEYGEDVYDIEDYLEESKHSKRRK